MIFSVHVDTLCRYHVVLQSRLIWSKASLKWKLFKLLLRHYLSIIEIPVKISPVILEISQSKETNDIYTDIYDIYTVYIL